MLLNDKVYNYLKWVVVIAMPSLGTALFAIGQIWGWEDIGKWVGTIVAVNAFLGACIGISTVQYNKALDDPARNQ